MGILKMLHPFMPFVTEEIYGMLPIKDAESIMISEYPKYNKKHVYEEEMFDVEAGLYEPNIYVGHYHVGGREEFKIPTKENYKISAYKDIIDLIREYENQNKKYQLYENSYTIEELRIGYRVITGLDNDDEFSDEELYQYMLETMKEEK